jgi:hypothetical protein
METETAAQGPNQPRFLSRMPSRWVLLTFLCLALVVRGRVMLGNLDSLERDPDAYRDVAWNVYFQGTLGFWSDASSAIEPTATRPPLYPLLLSGMYFLRFTPDGPGLGLLHVLLGVCTVWIAWRLGLAWGLPPIASLLAAALVMVDPILLNQSVLAMTETLATLLAAIALLVLTLVGPGRRGIGIMRALPACISNVVVGSDRSVPLAGCWIAPVCARRCAGRRRGRGTRAVGDSQ